MPGVYMLAAAGFLGLVLVIGLVSTWENIKGTKGPKERAFVMRSNTIAWMIVVIFFALLYVIPQPYCFLLLVPYFLVFPFVVRRFVSRRLLIRRLEEMKASVAEKS